MHAFRNTLLALSVVASVAPAYGAWGDVSYDTNTTIIDEDTSAQYEIFGTLQSVLLSSTLSGKSESAVQNFESGFTSGQTVNNWVSIGSNKVRFGFGNALNTIQWQGLIGGIDTSATTFGLTHPHGTYGNVAGVTDSPRNYVADLNFITSATTGGSHYLVMQFDRPISFLSFAMLDYGTVGDKFSFSLWNGEDLDTLVKFDQGTSGALNANRTVQDWRPDGGFDYIFGKGATWATPSVDAPTFNIAIVYLDSLDPTVGFDNFTVGMSSVPEPATLPLAGLGLLGMFAALRPKRASAS